MKSIPYVVALLLVCGLAGCVSEAEKSSNAKKPALDGEQVLAIAREAVRTNDTWLANAEFEPPHRDENDSWSVVVWRLPKTPGGHRFIGIDPQGVVTNYFRGR